MEAPTLPREHATHIDAVNAPRWLQALTAYNAAKPPQQLTPEQAREKAKAFERKYVVKAVRVRIGANQ